MANRSISDRPVIGVTGPDRGGRAAWIFTRWALRRAGARAYRLTPSKPIASKPLQGLIIGGGDDIDPQRYGQVAKLSVSLDRKRDELEWRMLEQAVREDLPVLGICRGAQMLNVFHGGTLHQHLLEVIENLVLRRTVLPRKTIAIDPHSQLAKIMGGVTELRVNSLHHQGVDRLAQGFCIAARDDVGIVQAIEHMENRFMLGVQWHPEYLPQSRTQQMLFAALARAARVKKEAVEA